MLCYIIKELYIHGVHNFKLICNYGNSAYNIFIISKFKSSTVM